MMTTAGKKFHNLLWSRFLIIMQNVNMVAKGKRKSRLNPKLEHARNACRYAIYALDKTSPSESASVHSGKFGDFEVAVHRLWNLLPNSTLFISTLLERAL